MKIEDIELLPEHVGRAVRYVASHGAVQHGRIKSWNEHFVFCWYGIGDTAAATDPKDLRWGT